jgi:hypothetical protein
MKGYMILNPPQQFKSILSLVSGWPLSGAKEHAGARIREITVKKLAVKSG